MNDEKFAKIENIAYIVCFVITAGIFIFCGLEFSGITHYMASGQGWK